MSIFDIGLKDVRGVASFACSDCGFAGGVVGFKFAFHKHIDSITILAYPHPEICIKSINFERISNHFSIGRDMNVYITVYKRIDF